MRKIAEQNQITRLLSIISLSQHTLGQARDKMGQNLLIDHDLSSCFDDEAGAFGTDEDVSFFRAGAIC
jgi:hypothetical protein